MHMLAISRRHPNGTALTPPQTQACTLPIVKDNVPPSHSLGEILSRFGCSLLRYPDSDAQLSNPFNNSPCFENPAAWTPTPDPRPFSTPALSVGPIQPGSVARQGRPYSQYRVVQRSRYQ